MKMIFEKGDRVSTPRGSGVVLCRRMNSANLSEVSAYSVLLDSDKKASNFPPFPSANGTIFAVNDVAAA